ncbi:MAG: fimbria/pilus periplasmic chaperone [Pseudomonadota bacterium]
MMRTQSVKNLFGILLGVLLLFAGFSTQVMAVGNLMVTPTRVVFEKSTRTAQVTLINQDSQTSNFRISFIRQNMTEDGEFIAAGESEAGLYSDPMIRFSPRQVSLPPGQSQVIRLLLRKPGDLPDGEYRSHMLFQSLPPASSSSVENVASDESEGIKIELIPIVGVSIPVIVRHGKLSSRVVLTDAGIIPESESGGGPKISVDIGREGDASAYGDFRATFTPSGGQPVIVAQANNVAVYSNLDMRRFSMPLSLPSGINLLKGKLDVYFIESGTDIESGTLAQTSLVLN